MTVLQRLVPDVIVVEETTTDVPAQALLPEEARIIVGAVARRRAEFATGRECARRALVRLGYPSSPILTGQHREPLWPPGVVGSITHCSGYRAAAVARADDVSTLGIDAESDEPLPEGVAELVTVGDECGQLARLARSHPGIAWDRVLFSAKESIYKAWFPLTGRWLDFVDCEITIRPHDGTFVGQLLVPGPRIAARTIEQFSGTWAIHDHLILTAVFVLSE